MRTCPARSGPSGFPPRRASAPPGQVPSLLGVVAGLALGVGAPAAPVREGPKAGAELEIEVRGRDGKMVKMVFCRVPAGKATLGSPAAEADRRPDEVEHPFTTAGFWLGKYEVTQAEWAAVTGANPSAFDGTRENGAKGLDTTRYPVEQVSWDDCQSFVRTVNESARGAGIRVRLPTEDEWEYACRAGKGNKPRFHIGGDLDEARANIGHPCSGRTAEVGSYARLAPHPWGLCDLHGNVWEWCETRYDGTGPDRVNRGGSWGNDAKDCRSAYRNRNAPGTRSYYLGVRLAVVPAAP